MAGGVVTEPLTRITRLGLGGRVRNGSLRSVVTGWGRGGAVGLVTWVDSGPVTRRAHQPLPRRGRRRRRPDDAALVVLYIPVAENRPGAVLSRPAPVIPFQEMARRYRRITVDETDIEYKPGFGLRGPERLRVRFGKA
jgi:hypothetical protein